MPLSMEAEVSRGASTMDCLLSRQNKWPEESISANSYQDLRAIISRDPSNVLFGSKISSSNFLELFVFESKL